MQIHVIRHTRPDVAAGVCYGQADVAVAASFDDEVLALKNSVKSDYNKVITSPLRRCKLLAERLAEGQALSIDPRLKELDFGEWELQTWDQIGEEKTKRWAENFIDLAPDQGETLASMQTRVLEFWFELAQSNQDNGCLAIVTHAGVIRVLMAHILEIPLKNIFQFNVGYGCVLEVNKHSFRSHTSMRFLKP